MVAKSRQQAARAAAGLVHVLGPRAVSLQDADRLAVSSDLWPRQLLRMYLRKPLTLPAAVVWPENAEQIQRLCMYARSHGLQLLPVGAGSGVVGGATPAAHQVVVDLKRLSRVHRIDGSARMASAEVGILGELWERQLQRAGFTQGHFPSSIYCSTLGGWLAARGAGQMSSRYGKIEDQLLGGTAVLGDGTWIHQEPGPVALPPLSTLVGSEGTLGFFIEAAVRIHPLPQHRAWRAFDFPNLESGLAAARAWLDADVVPSVTRIYDPLDSWLHRGTHGSRRRGDKGPSLSAALGAHFPRTVSFVGDRLGAGRCRAIVGFEGDQAVVEADLMTALDISRQHGAEDCGPEPALAWYEKRYAVSYRMSNVFRAGVCADTMEVACRWDRLVPTYEAVRRAALQARAQVLAHFSHIYREGGSIYFTFVFPAEIGEAGYDALWDTVLLAAYAAGANVSHHHGIGQLKSRMLRDAVGDGGAALQRVRQAFDPGQVLNGATLSQDEPARAIPSAAPSYQENAADTVVCVAGDAILEQVETGLRRTGQTLGPAAALFPSLQVTAAARQVLLWRHNRQFNTIESLIAGVDSCINGRLHRFTRGPRAAEGPDLLQTLLAGDVQHVFLRCDRLSTGPWWQCDTDIAACLRLAVHLAQQDCARLLRFMLQARGQQACLRVQLPSVPTQARACAAVLVDVAEQQSIRWQQNAPEAAWQVLAWAAQPLALSWSALRVRLQTLGDQGMVLPWMDPVGAAGFIEGAAAALPAVAQRPAPAIPQASMAAPDAIQPASAPWDGRLRLPRSRVALNNCTYCPKLCRFACPTAVGAATETYTPRQLMLTANLDRTRRRPLTADVTRALYSCVDCRGCRSFCDHDNDVATELQRARAELWRDRAAPKFVQDMVLHFQQAGVIAGTDVVSRPTADGRGASTYVFLGCQNHDASVAAMTALLRHVRAHLESVHVQDAVCCGHPLWRWGAYEEFARHAHRTVSQLPGHVRSWVVDDPGCAFTFERLYPSVGVKTPRIVLATDFLSSRTLEHVAGRWAPHDACFARRWLGAPALRTLLPAASMRPASVLEGDAGCCGGMLLPLYDAVLADKVARDYTHDLLGGGAQCIASASPTCSRRLRAVGAPVHDIWNLLPHTRENTTTVSCA